MCALYLSPIDLAKACARMAGEALVHSTGDQRVWNFHPPLHSKPPSFSSSLTLSCIMPQAVHWSQVRQQGSLLSMCLIPRQAEHLQFLVTSMEATWAQPLSGSIHGRETLGQTLSWLTPHASPLISTLNPSFSLSNNLCYEPASGLATVNIEKHD